MSNQDTRSKVKRAASIVHAVSSDIDRVEVAPDPYQYMQIRLELRKARELLNEALAEMPEEQKSDPGHGTLVTA